MFITDDSEAYRQFQLEAVRYDWLDTTAEDGILFEQKFTTTGQPSESTEANLHVVMIKGRKNENGLLQIIMTQKEYKITLRE